MVCHDGEGAMDTEQVNLTGAAEIPVEPCYGAGGAGGYTGGAGGYLTGGYTGGAGGYLTGGYGGAYGDDDCDSKGRRGGKSGRSGRRSRDRKSRRGGDKSGADCVCVCEK
jgi:hypothetical protein